MKTLVPALAAALVLLSCSDDDLSFDVAAQCECSNEWTFDDGAIETEFYTATFYCFENPIERQAWVDREVEVCDTEAHPDAVARTCSCSCTPTLNC